MSQTAAEKKTEDWMTTKWRPLMAVTYMATIWFDFIVGPVLFNILQYWNPGQAITSYTPITLQGGGLYHISMGAILGIAAWTRGKEKVAAIEAGDNKQGFNLGTGAFPEVKASEPQWVNPNQGITPQQTWAQPAPAPVAPPVATPAYYSSRPTSIPSYGGSTFTSASGKLGPTPDPQPEL
jgi:hypothetical protein